MMSERGVGLRILITIATLAIIGCAVQPKMQYEALPGTTTSLGQALATCKYESTASTQTVDYGYRSILFQSLDQSARRSNLMELCMRAQGYILEIAPQNGSQATASDVLLWPTQSGKLKEK